MAQSQQNTKRLGLGLLVGLALLALNAWLLAKLIWAIVTPIGPIGTIDPHGQTVSLAALATTDPFFRQAKSDVAANVTSLSLKLFGTRIDEATGQSSAIIATPDGLQSSYIVGDTILPGVKLASVVRDGVTLDRGGAVEKLFLDQSVPAPVAAPAVSPLAVSQPVITPAPPPPPLPPPPADVPAQGSPQ